MTQPSSVVAFEGNIGVGKSTLCAKLKLAEPARCSVYKEQGNEKFLQLFYSSPSKYGFAYQWGMLKTRRYQLALAQRDLKHGRVPPKQYYFWDRSMLGDYVFALWNHLLGGISPQEMAVYEDEFGGSIRRLGEIEFLGDVACYVYLDDEPAACKQRVEQLRGNPSEAGIPLAYYEGIDDIHFELFVRRLIPAGLCKVLVLTWGQYDSETAMLQTLEATVVDQQAGARVTFHDASFDRATVDAMECGLYVTAEDVLESYARLPALFECRDVYMPERIMQIEPADKNVVANDFGVKFYRNEYKRVVLAHLSRGAHVHFYQ